MIPINRAMIDPEIQIYGINMIAFVYISVKLELRSVYMLIMITWLIQISSLVNKFINVIRNIRVLTCVFIDSIRIHVFSYPNLNHCMHVFLTVSRFCVKYYIHIVQGRRTISTPELLYNNKCTQCFNLVVIAHHISITTPFHTQ